MVQMSSAPVSPRRLRQGVGSTGICLASAFGLSPSHAAAADQPVASHEAVIVTARKPALLTLSEKIQNTAQSINVIPQTVLHEQGVNTLQDALKNVPGVTLNAGEGGAHGDTINLRGFPASDDFFLDGLRDDGYYTRDSFDLEALEVYKGPASTLFGRGSTGGVVNQVSKTPHPGDSVGATFTAGTNDEARGAADLDFGLGEDAAVRLNAMGQRSDIAGRPNALTRRWGVAPSIALGLNGPTRLTLSYLYQGENNIPDLGIPFVGDAPAKVGRSVDYGLPSDDRTKADVNVVTARLDHDFGHGLSISEALRYGDYGFVSRITGPHYGATAPTLATPLSTILVYRDRPGVDGAVRTAMSSTQLNDRFDTGPLAHTLIVGLELDRETADLTRYANQLNAIAPTPLLNPDPNEAFPGHQTSVTQRPDTRTTTVSGLLGDTIDLGAHWTLVGALRLDRFAAHYDEPITNTHLQHTDTIATPRVSIVYKPTPATSLYVAYGTSYDPSAENLSLSKKTADLDPERDHTFEAGAKAAVLRGRLALTAAVFDTEMTNARVIDPVSQATSLSGNLRVRGIELGASGYLTERWEILAGYTYLDAKTVQSTNPAQIGQRIPNTAPSQANLWSLYEFTEDFKAGLGVTYLGRRAADASGRVHIPGYVTFDGMLSYRLNRHLALQLNGYNLADRFYFTNAYYSTAVENHVVPGAGRTVTLTAAVTY